MSFRRGVAWLLAFVTAGSVLAIAASTAPVVAQDGRTLTIGLGGETTTLNANIGQGGGGALGISVFEAMYNNLLSIDPRGRLLPELATEYRVLEDKLTWQFKLRQGVRFHNGEELTAESVKTTLDDIITSTIAVSNVKRRMAQVERVDIVDRYTVNVKTKIPFVLLPKGLADAFIYPARYYRETGPDAFSDKPSGTGQFRFVEWRKGISITLARNPAYWGPKATIDRVVFRPFPESAARIAALERGEIDIAANVPPDDAQRLRAKGFNIVFSPLGQAMLVQLVPVRGTPLEDRRVRQALNFAIDKNALVEAIMGGYTKVLRGQLVGPDGFGYNPLLVPYPYDPAKARALLAQAGYPNGFSIRMQCSQGRYVKQKEVCEAVVGQLAKVAVRVDLEMSEWGTFINRILTNAPDRAPMWYLGLNYFPAMDAEFIIQHYITASPLRQFSHPRLDELYRLQAQEFDTARRLKLIQEFMDVVREEAPNVFLFQAPAIYALNKRVQGFTPTPDDAIRLDGVSFK
ncbi:MAG: hypothetical protein A2W26_07690 [Acidobacteria bacterium RBG_16_64_8]|nr:MAG: hypothetical protein A2W26_07690 [Acidobacteria bacterium RBG_16_64_8]